jgi:hypothetical protein
MSDFTEGQQVFRQYVLTLMVPSLQIDASDQFPARTPKS